MSEFIKSLTKQELNILKLVAQGLTNQEIADKLFVTKITVATHLCNLYQKAEMFREGIGASIMRLRLALLYNDYNASNRYRRALTEIKEIAAKSNQAPCLDVDCDCENCQDEITSCGVNCMEKGIKKILEIVSEVENEQ